jgi:hypothetical protein
MQNAAIEFFHNTQKAIPSNCEVNPVQLDQQILKVDGLINGKRTTIAIDTCAAMSIVDSKFVRHLQLEPCDHIQLRGIGENILFTPVAHTFTRM